MRGRTPVKIRGCTAAAVLPALCVALFALNGADSISDAPVSPGRWKIDIHVETKGRYTLRSISETYRGEFSGKWDWSGFIEDDDGDFLLIHAYSDVRDWTMREEATGNPSPSFFTEEDIPEKPSLNISYILRQHNVIDIRFSINGFTVPQHGADVSYSLPLPSSRGDPPRGSITDYDASVVEGSNRIYLRTRDLRAPSAEKSFAWTWRKQDWLPRRERTVKFDSHHDAKVTVTLKPLG